MPEMPDIAAYIHALALRVEGKRLERVRLASPFFLRTVEPPLAQAFGRRVVGIERLGKRIVLGLDNDLFVILHLMIAGRLWWHEPGKIVPGGGRGLAAFDFESGTLLVTEAGSKKRASLHIVHGRGAMAAHDPGGLEPLTADLAAFAARLRQANHTVKRALTDPRLLSGIGNAYSDEILHRAKLSPIVQTQRMSDGEMRRLHAATLAVLREWVDRLAAEAERAWPQKVTAFRPEMAVHGRYGKPCPACGAPVQRIRFADNETNYCARCQTGGKLLADRSLSRLLHKDWPKTLDELDLLRPATASRKPS
ncbi:MAG: Fpg/Nei family DNA glycosylase [Alphaproteobacteria bacterium]